MNKAYDYICKVVKKEIKASKYIKKQCKILKKIFENKDQKYFLDEDEVIRVENATKLMNMASGLAVGKSVYESLVGFNGFLLFLFFVLSIEIIQRKEDMKQLHF